MIRFPDKSIADARHIIARPDLHDEGAVLDACELLEVRGDWMDCERAKALKTAMIRDAIDEINRKDRRRQNLRRIAGDAVGALILFALLYLFINPILIGEDDVIIAGHGRLLAAQRIDMTEVPTIVLTHLVVGVMAEKAPRRQIETPASTVGAA